MPFLRHSNLHLLPRTPARAFPRRYGEFEAIISIDSPAELSGDLPPRALGLVIEWANKYKKELQSDWQKAMAYEKLDKIEPLK